MVVVVVVVVVVGGDLLMRTPSGTGVLMNVRENCWNTVLNQGVE